MLTSKFSFLSMRNSVPNGGSNLFSPSFSFFFPLTLHNQTKENQTTRRRVPFLISNLNSNCYTRVHHSQFALQIHILSTKGKKKKDSSSSQRKPQLKILKISQFQTLKISSNVITDNISSNRRRQGSRRCRIMGDDRLRLSLTFFIQAQTTRNQVPPQPPIIFSNHEPLTTASTVKVPEVLA